MRAFLHREPCMSQLVLIYSLGRFITVNAEATDIAFINARVFAMCMPFNRSHRLH